MTNIRLTYDYTLNSIKVLKESINQLNTKLTLILTIGLGLVFAGQLIQLREKTPDYTKVAGKIFQWSITYLSLLSVLLVVAQLLKA